LNDGNSTASFDGKVGNMETLPFRQNTSCNFSHVAIASNLAPAVSFKKNQEIASILKGVL
jgi:hypothetical protein